MDANYKPLNFNPDPAAGFTVSRRPDGGMHLTFTDVNANTLKYWQKFSEDHLLGSDRLTRNLYDLRKVESVSERAVDVAVQLNSDPSTRNIRLAVVVGNDAVRQAIQKIADLTPVGGTRMEIFNDLESAENWLSRPMESMV